MTKTPKKLRSDIEALIERVLGEPPEDQYSVTRLVACAKALTDHGIRTKVMSQAFALDPEEWQRPLYVEALVLRGTTYAGNGRYGWEALIEQERFNRCIEGDYVDLMERTHINAEGFQEANPETGHEFTRAYSIVNEWALENTTTQAQAKPRSGPRL